MTSAAPPAAVDLALSFIGRKWAPIPVPFKSKRPIIDGWPDLRVTKETAAKHFSDRRMNVGVLLGEPSDWTVDVDVDDAIAVRLAPRILTPTATFGRRTKRRSHWIYRSVNAVTIKCTEVAKKKDDPRPMLVELRSTGGHTLFPGSTHTSGELVEWDAGNLSPIVEVPAVDLTASVKRLATACLLVRNGFTDEHAVALVQNFEAGALDGLHEAVDRQVREWLGLVAKKQRTTPTLVSISNADAIRRATAYIAKMPEAISGSGGHKALWDVALVLTKGFSLSEADAIDLVNREYNPRCSPPWSEKEVRHKIESAARKGKVPQGFLLDDEHNDWRNWATPFDEESRWSGEAGDTPSPAMSAYAGDRGEVLGEDQDAEESERVSSNPSRTADSAHGQDNPSDEDLQGTAAQASVPPNPDDWPEPVGFTGVDLPPFPVDALPKILRAWVLAESEATQTPPDLAAMLALAACSAAVSKRVVIEVKPGYTEPSNLFVAVVLPPGERKSAVFNDAVAPLREWEQEEGVRRRPELVAAAQRYRIIEKRLESSISAAAKSQGPDYQRAIAETEQIALELEEAKVPPMPRVFADDATPEALTTLLEEYCGRMAVMSPEGGVFEMMAGRYSDSPNLDVYLKGHAGDDIRVDRKGRKSEWVKAPALTLGLAIQPSVLERLAERPLMRGTGLLARFLYSIPQSRVGGRQVDSVPVPDHVRMLYHHALKALLAIPSDRTLRVRLSAGAFSVYRDFANFVEPQLAEFSSLSSIRDWGSKLPGAFCRVLSFLSLISRFESQLVSNITDCEAKEEDAKRARAIAEYLIPHAQAAFKAMGADEKTTDSKTALKFVQGKHWQSFSRRELQLGLRHHDRLSKAENLDVALQDLVRRGFIRLANSSAPKGPGRPAGPSFLVHPSLGNSLGHK
jgi:replicative DNA helicase